MNPDMFRFSSQPQLEKSSFMIGWAEDAGGVSPETVDRIVKAVDGDSFCRIEPAGFFPVDGVTVQDDVAQFPESRFFYSEATNTVMFRSDEPQTHRYDFLNGIIDLAQHYGKADAMYTVNGLASMIPHTASRRVVGVYSGPVMQGKLRPFVSAGMTWQGTPHISTYLLWLAKSRGLSSASLWVEVPFYLSSFKDFWAIKAAVSLLGILLGRHWDLHDLDELIAGEDEMFTQLRKDDPDIDAKIRSLEAGELLSRQDQLELVEAVQSALQERG